MAPGPSTDRSSEVHAGSLTISKPLEPGCVGMLSALSESHMYACTACGAVVECDVREVATRCAYCTSPLVDSTRAASAIDAVVPFRLSKRAALERLRAHIGDRWWTPEALRKLARRGRLQTDAVRGVLVPFFAYDATLRADYSARVGVYWERTETVKAKTRRAKPDKAEQPQTRTKVIRETEWFDLRGSMGMQLEDHLVCASAGLSSQRAHALAPFDLGRAAAFDSRLLLGWSAELPSKARRDIDREAHATLSDLGRAHLRNKHLTGDAHRLRTVELDVEIHRVRLVLLPIWLASVRLGKTPIQIAINGQTGRCVGPVPTSAAKVAAVVVAALFAVLVALWIRGGPAVDVTECENCGGIVVYDADAQGLRCVFCGDVSLNAIDLEDAIAPSHAVLFEVSADDAQGLFRAWTRSSLWAPRALRHRSAELERVWVPAWRVRAEVHATWTGLVDARTKSRKKPKSGVDIKARETWIPASASLSEAELAALAPFRDSGVVDWDPAKVDAPFEVGGASAQTAVQQARQRFREAVRGDLIRSERLRDCRVSVLLDDVQSRPLMLPIYVGCVRFRDQPWRFVINGQTGRVTGRTPIDRSKVAVAIAALVAAALAWLWWTS